MPLDFTFAQEKDEVLAILECAKERVEKGWCQKYYHVYQNNIPYFCLVGSLAPKEEEEKGGSDFLLRKGGSIGAAVQLIVDLLENRAVFINPENWNDSPQRTKEDVLNLLDEAISVRISSRILVG